MKLIVAIVQDQDVNALMDSLTEKKYSCLLYTSDAADE